MAKSSLDKKNLQRKQYRENKKKNDELTQKYNLKEQEKNERKSKCKKFFKIGGLISLCVILCAAVVLPLSIYFAGKLKQKNKLFMNELVAAQNDEGKWGYINSDGDKKIDFKFEYAYPFAQNKLALVKYDGKYGYINKNSEFVIEPTYDEAFSFNDNIAVCAKDEKYGAIDKNGETIIEFKYKNISSFKNDYAIAVYNGYYGVINKKGETVVNFEYELIGQINDNYFTYLKNQKYHVEFIHNDKSFDELFSPEEYDFQEFSLTSNGYVIYRQAGYYGLINGEGKQVFENIYDKLTYNTGDYLIYSTTGDFYGYLDFDGNKIIEDQFDSATDFTDGLGVLKIINLDKYAIIDKNGTVKYTFECKTLSNFSNDRAVFKKGTEYGVINKDGKGIVEAKYKYISSYFDDGYAIFINSENKYGVINKQGKEIIKGTLKNIVG